MQSELFPSTIYLTKVKPDLNQHRFYSLYLLPDLFGGCDLMRIYGRIGTAGRTMKQHYKDEGLAQDQLNSLMKTKIRRGYQ